MICIRIGTDKPNPQYFPHIKYLLDCPYSIGILGGKPQQALYIIGYQEDSLIYLDPHYVQDSIEFFNSITPGLTEKYMKSYEPQHLRGISMKRIDSSLGFGFFVKDENEFQDLYRYLITGNLIFENWAIGLQNRCEIEDKEAKELVQMAEFIEEEEVVEQKLGEQQDEEAFQILNNKRKDNY